MAALTALLARRQTGQGKGTPPPPLPPGKLLVTVPEVCQMLSIGRSLAYALIAQGIIPSVRLGERRVLVPVAALQEAIMILVQPSR